MPRLSDYEIRALRDQGVSWDRISERDGRARSVLWRRWKRAEARGDLADEPAAATEPEPVGEEARGWTAEAPIEGAAVVEGPVADAGSTADPVPAEPYPAIEPEPIALTTVTPTMYHASVELPVGLITAYDVQRSLGYTGNLSTWLAEAVEDALAARGHRVAYLLGDAAITVGVVAEGGVNGQVQDAEVVGGMNGHADDDRLRRVFEFFKGQGFEGDIEEWLVQVGAA